MKVYPDDYYHETLEDGTWVDFNPSNGFLQVTDNLKGYGNASFSKREAINLASKLLQWGTSS